ncbi:hypothetical protein J437_LFUL004231 [Ladona fulva]|uniref:Uncharacterized protein n=1 Tax=Ladona fulva TaxID=123851 RepID=A0A8K0K3F9_LADFU|nr:hypothetical protein J437_LFUL004231 [Ladona fulva]
MVRYVVAFNNGGPSAGGSMYRGGKDFPGDVPRGGVGPGVGGGGGPATPSLPPDDYMRKGYPPPMPPVQISEADRPNDCEIIVLNKKQRKAKPATADVGHNVGGRLGPLPGPHVPFPPSTERHPENIQALFTNLVEQRPLTVLQYDRVIREYAEVIERRLKKLGLGVDLLFPNEDIPLVQVLASISSRGKKREIQVRVELGEAKPPIDIGGLKDPIPKPNTQQAELQHRILNILNSNRPGGGVPSPGIVGGGMVPVPTPVPAPTGVPPPANWPPSGMSSGVGGSGPSSGAPNPGPSPLLSDPTVQKALDSLIQGDLLRKISSSSAAAASTASAVSSAASMSAPVVSSSASSGTMLGNPPVQALFGAYAQPGGRRF